MCTVKTKYRTWTERQRKYVFDFQKFTVFQQFGFASQIALGCSVCRRKQRWSSTSRQSPAPEPVHCLYTRHSLQSSVPPCKLHGAILHPWILWFHPTPKWHRKALLLPHTLPSSSSPSSPLASSGSTTASSPLCDLSVTQDTLPSSFAFIIFIFSTSLVLGQEWRSLPSDLAVPTQPCSFLLHTYIHLILSLGDTAMYSLFLSKFMIVH